MQAGFAMLEAGSVSETHVKSILIKVSVWSLRNVVDFFVQGQRTSQANAYVSM